MNAQVGKRHKNIGVRGGVIAGKAGLGLDAYLGPYAKISAEAYDPNNGTFRLKSQIRIADSTYLMGEFHDFTDSDNRAAYFGLKREF